jgi:hypothetical protein
MIRRMPARRLTRAAVTAEAAALALAAALPAVWWEPLHLDERVMLEYSPHSPQRIVREIFVDRGGAPLQYLVEHVTLSWPAGLAGLRLPSLVFFLLALAFAGPVAARLVGEREALITIVLLAASPLAVGLATFARMYALFLWLVLAATWLSLRAGRSGARRDWIAAGALAGGMVYAHPIAPLYALPAFAAGIAVEEGALREALRRARPGIVAGVLVALPYVYALAVLRSRYGVGESGPLGTTAGRSVPEESLYALTPRGTPGLIVMSAFAVAGAVRLLRRRRRIGVLLVVWLALPIVFFTAVPAHTRFFDRYVLSALPAFLMLVASGCLAVPRGRGVLVPVLAAMLIGLSIADDASRLRSLYDLDLRALPRPAATEVLLSSTGLPRSDRPPELLDDLVELRTPHAERLEELPAIDPRFDAAAVHRGVANVHAFLGATGRRNGFWVFRGSERRVRAAARRLRTDAALSVRRIGPELLVVRTRTPLSRIELIELAVRVRDGWGTRAPVDRWPRTIAAVDRTALG